VSTYLAADLGAESGRVMRGTLDGGRVVLDELRRFPNGGVERDGGLYWDIERLDREIGPDVSAIDSWGCDYVLLDECGQALGPPRHYRDPRTQGAFAEVAQRISREEIFAETGCQFLEINTLYQLWRTDLRGAAKLLFVPDYLHYLRTGRIACERTIASTSQLYNPRTGDWAWTAIDKLGFPRTLFPPIVDGPTASHDTASAVAAVPAQGEGWAYVSSGTWSLMGVELPESIVEPEVLRRNFTNEAGAFGTIRLLKNLSGMWPLQQLRRRCAAEGREYTYAQLTEMAAEPVGEDARAARAIFDGLASDYAETKRDLEALTERAIDRIHIVGGGSRNELLNQLTADACRCDVVAGPVEATAAGNILVQACSSLEEVRAIVRASFETRVFHPR
jgi:rhamnulokinase